MTSALLLFHANSKSTFSSWSSDSWIFLQPVVKDSQRAFRLDIYFLMLCISSTQKMKTTEVWRSLNVLMRSILISRKCCLTCSLLSHKEAPRPRKLLWVHQIHRWPTIRLSGSPLCIDLSKRCWFLRPIKIFLKASATVSISITYIKLLVSDLKRAKSPRSFFKCPIWDQTQSWLLNASIKLYSPYRTSALPIH